VSEGLARYLREIAAQPDVDAWSEREILEEIQNHLQEALTDLEKHGRSRRRAWLWPSSASDRRGRWEEC
jgi:hypothetical protein